MQPDSRADDAVTGSLREAVSKLLARLSRAVFGVCAVAVGLIALFVGAGSTGDSASVFLIVGVASLLVGAVTISRLPNPAPAEKTAPVTESDATDEPTDETADRRRQRAD